MPNLPSPLVTVVIPCHDYQEYIAGAIRSVQMQSMNNFECFIINDRSTDDSEKVIMDTIKYDARFKMFNVDFGSLSATRNFGINQGCAPFLCCLDADDEIGDKDFLEVLVTELEKDNTLGIAFTGIRIMDADGNLGHKSEWPKGYSFDAMAQRRNQIPSLCVFRRDMWERAGGFKVWYRYAEDAEFWLTGLSLGFSATHIDTDWFHYRLHNKSASQVHRTGEVKEPDWTEFHPWSKDGGFPFAAGGRPPLGSWPVRFYLKPDVTVIIPVGEGHEQAVRDALHSVEGQTFRNWECIVINDTFEPLDTRGFPWAKVIRTTGGGGAGYARNFGAKMANSPFLVFLDADDILKPAFLQKTLEAYRQHGRYAYCDWMTDDRRGNVEIHPTPEYGRESLWEHPSLHPVTALIPRTWFNAVGGFDESLKAFEDVDLYMKFFTHGYCGLRIPEPLLVYNLDTGKRRKSGEAFKAEFLALLKKRYGSFMEGKQMCDCVEPPKGKQAAPPTPDNAADYREAYGEPKLVQYTWAFAPESPVTFKGPATKAPYGQRGKNEVFYVWEADLIAGGDMFTLIENYDTEPQPTIVPPAPEPLAEWEGMDHLIHDELVPIKNPSTAIEFPNAIKASEVKAAIKKSTPPRGTRKAKATRRKIS